MRWGNDIDWRELNDAEFDENGVDYEPYEGPIPPANTTLRGVVKKVWATENRDGHQMFKVLFVASGNVSGREKYDGLTVWANISWTNPEAKFAWAPFFSAIGVTLGNVRANTIIGEEDSRGTVVTAIGPAKFPIPVRVVTKMDRYQGAENVAARTWLAPEAEQVEGEPDSDFDDEFEDDEPAPRRPAPKSTSKGRTPARRKAEPEPEPEPEPEDEEDFDEPEDDDFEEDGEFEDDFEDEPEPPRRGRPGAAKKQAGGRQATRGAAPARRPAKNSRREAEWRDGDEPPF